MVAHAGLSLLHEDPVAVEFILGLQEVAAVGPQGGRRGGDDGRSGAARETRHEMAPLVVGRHVLGLSNTNKTKQNSAQFIGNDGPRPI